MLTEQTIERILDKLPSLRIAVLGDLFLDRYLNIDAGLTEPSLETGLDAYQVTGVRSYPGAAGTIVNNLVALGVGVVMPIAVIGDDAEGFELRQALAKLPAVDVRGVYSDSARRTPTYVKPTLQSANAAPCELNRLDIKNRTSMSAEAEQHILAALEGTWPEAAATLVLDQVSELNCGVVTGRIRERLTELSDSNKLILADSRERIGEFRGVSLKPNRTECTMAAGVADAREATKILAGRCGKPVYCTCGADGILLAWPGCEQAELIPGYPVNGPIDAVGAGDSTSAGIAAAIACGASLQEAAGFGNLVASITVTQIGVTGTAPPEQVRNRWREIQAMQG